MNDYRIEAATKEEWAERAFAAEQRNTIMVQATIRAMRRVRPDLSYTELAQIVAEEIKNTAFAG
jgi:hypothetical protein